MDKISIIFAYRNREITRIKAAMDSLKNQKEKAFEVIFINYGSEQKISNNVEKLLLTYNFIKYYYLEVGQQLWNKSRALNFGIKKANCSYIFIADVDIVFSPDAVKVLLTRTSFDFFSLFTMGYLDQKESAKLTSDFKFEELNPGRFGDVNGMILTSKKSIIEIKGYDEFFHFYGSEDVDLYSRLETAGYKSNLVTDTYFYHIWHRSYQKSEEEKLSLNPRVANMLRINQQHYFYHHREKIIIPGTQKIWGEIIGKQEMDQLKTPTKKIQLNNTLSEIEHFMNEELEGINNEILELRVVEDPYYDSAKHKIKKLLGKQSQIYCSLKEVNDIILKKIIFKYRNSNYSYEISPDFKSIIFKIQL